MWGNFFCNTGTMLLKIAAWLEGQPEQPPSSFSVSTPSR